MKHYLWQVLVAVDQLANALLLGHADETLSARAYRVELAGKLWARLTRPCIDVVFYAITLGHDKQHCYTSYLSEFNRKHLPSHYTTTHNY
jgi:hypothetical protein